MESNPSDSACAASDRLRRRILTNIEQSFLACTGRDHTTGNNLRDVYSSVSQYSEIIGTRRSYPPPNESAPEHLPFFSFLFFPKKQHTQRIKKCDMHEEATLAIVEGDFFGLVLWMRMGSLKAVKKVMARCVYQMNPEGPG